MADSIYLKDNLSGLVPVEVAAGIMKDVAQGSTLLRMAKVEPMKSDKKKYTVWADTPGAYWVGEGERIKTSVASFIFPEMTAKKLAVIIPVTKEKMKDTTVDVFGELRPQMAEAFYTKLDKAGIFGVESPYSTSIMGAINNSGHKVEVGANGSGKLDLDVSDAMALVEDAGYDVDGFIATNRVKNDLRKLRDANGNTLYCEGTNGKEFYNVPIAFVRKGWDGNSATIIGGQWQYAIVGIRDNIEYEVLTEATLQATLDADGKPLSLAEQDMVAIKATMRIGFLCIKEEAFCAITPPSSSTLGTLTVTSAAGTDVGNTKITVSPTKAGGNSYKYKVAANPTMPSYDQVCTTGWTAWDGSADITAATGQKIVIAEVDGSNKAKKAGIATVTAKA